MGWIAPLIAIGAEIGGAALSATGQLKGAAAAAQAGRLNAADILATGLANAQEAEYQAAIVHESTEVSERQFRYQAGLAIARGRAAQGASGLVANEGSPLDVLAENVRQEESNALEMRRNGQIQEQTIRRQEQADIERAGRQAAVARSGGQAASTRAKYGAGATILSGGASAAQDVNKIGIAQGWWG